jgi:hypothetical protein
LCKRALRTHDIVHVVVPSASSHVQPFAGDTEALAVEGQADWRNASRDRLVALGEDARVAIWGGARADVEQAILLDVTHACGLAHPVGAGVLDNTQRIDPEVAEPELAGDGDGIAKGGWKQGRGDARR